MLAWHCVMRSCVEHNLLFAAAGSKAAGMRRTGFLWLILLLFLALGFNVHVFHRLDQAVINQNAPESPPPHSAGQYLHKNKRGRQIFHPVTSISMRDLLDIALLAQERPELLQKHPGDKHALLDLLAKAGIARVDSDVVDILPHKDEIRRLFYSKEVGPLVKEVPPDACRRFRDHVPPANRYVGAAGLYNTGTNALTYNLRANLVLEENTAQKFRGILSQVPWHKHTFWRDRSAAKDVPMHRGIDRNHVLPIVIIRDIHSWVTSMCKAPYDVVFSSSSTECLDRARRHVTLFNRTFDSLFHVWNEYYREYTRSDGDRPRLVVRFEDLLFQPEQVVARVRECVGASRTHDQFQYVVGQSKWEHVKELQRPQSNWVSAMIQHGRADLRLKWGADELRLVDQKLLEMFQYRIDV